jgi:hypothetical protein
MTATVSAEAGVVFAKASTSLGVTLGAGYSGTQAFTYGLNVPSGQVRRHRPFRHPTAYRPPNAAGGIPPRGERHGIPAWASA